MVELKKSKSEYYDYLVDSRVNEISTYRDLVNAFLSLKSFFNKFEDYDFYFGGKFDNLTPDVFIKSKSSFPDIIGDGKKSLPLPPKFDEGISKEEYMKDYGVIRYFEKILPKCVNDISKYYKKLNGVSEPHDCFVLYPSESNKSLKIMESRKLIDNKMIFLSFIFKEQDKKFTINVTKEKGNFSDDNIDSHFELNGVFARMSDFAELFSQSKLFIVEEASNAPIEWVVLVLWQYIIPSCCNTNSKEMILAQLNGRQMVLNITLKDISDFLKNNYRIPYYKNDREMIKLRDIKKAMKVMASFTEVNVANEGGVNPEYRIFWKKLSGDNLIRTLVRKINDKKFKQETSRKFKPQEYHQNNPNQKQLSDF